MTPEESVTAAFRAASLEMSKGMISNKAEAYHGFVVQASHAINEAARSFASVAENRPSVSTDDTVRLENYAYNQILQTAITVLMALGHFPYLDQISNRVVQENLH